MSKTFSMSCYATKEDLFREKSEYFENKYNDLLDKYQELIMGVARKYPNESRHETALKYILQCEKSTEYGPELSAKDES